VKKSQAIELVENYLKENVDLKWLDEDYSKIAKNIVNMLVESGMKPPIKKQCPVIFVDKYEWEKE
jgi:hypothetical protein